MFRKYGFQITVFLIVVQVFLLYYSFEFSDVTKASIFKSVIIFIIQSIIPITLFINRYSIKTKISETYKIVFLVVGLISFFSITNWLNNVKTKIPVSTSISDVIPQMDTLADRFNNHEFPYKTIYFEGYKMQPTYMPLQWLPFTIARCFNIDGRVFALLVFSLFYSIFMFYIFLKRESNISMLTVLLLLLPLYIIYAQINSAQFYITVEELVVGIYLLIPLFLMLKKYHWASFFIVLCLLSRYSIVLWVPLYVLVMWLYNKKVALQNVAIILVGIVSIYAFPFLLKDSGIFLKAYKYHSGAALGEWLHLNEYNMPCHLFDGQGLACLFYQLGDGALANKLKLLQVSHLSICFGFIVICALYYIKNNSKISKEIFLCCTLLMYIFLFYNFIQIPYKYLFILPTILSITTAISVQSFYKQHEAV